MVRRVRIAEQPGSIRVVTTRQGVLISSESLTDSTNPATDEITSFGYGKSFFDTVTITDSISNFSEDIELPISDDVSPADLIGVDDGITYTFAKVFSDTVLATDSDGVIISSGFQTDPSDAANMVDSIAFAMAFARSFTDSISTPTDLAELLVTFNRQFNDSSQATEAPIFTVGKTLADSSQPTDRPELAFAKPNITDSVAAPTDEINSFGFGKTLTDAANAVDLVAVPDGSTFTLAKTETDTATISQVFERTVSFNRDSTDGFADSTTISDLPELVWTILRDFTDSTDITTDTQIFTFGKTLADSSQATEAPIFTVGKILADSNSVVESHVFEFDNAYGDSVTPGDLPELVWIILRDSTDGFVDSVQASDTQVISQGFVRSFAHSVSITDSNFETASGTEFDLTPDSASVSDTQVISQGWGRLPTDSATPGDLFERVVSFDRDFADSVTVTELLVGTSSNVKTDTQLVSDNDILTFGKVISDSSTATESHVFGFENVYSDSSTIIEAPVFNLSTFIDSANHILSPIDTPVFGFGLNLENSVTVTDSAPAFTSGLPGITDASTAGDSAQAFLQSYFAEEYVTFTERYVETSQHSL